MASKKRRRPRRRASTPPEDELVEKLRALARSEDAEDPLGERDAMVAMVVVRAIDRAKELAAVEGSGLALRRALSAAEKPMAGYVERHLARKRSARRKKP